MYPSIIRAKNMCHSTVVLDPRFDNQPGVEYDEVRWEEEGKTTVNRFVKSREGILPRVLTDLAAARKRAKKQMAEAPDVFSRSLFDGKQKAIKVMMNSIYGATGASTGFLPCKQIASSVTAYGREMILKTKQFVEENYGAQVVYGDTDSVFCKFKPEASMEAVFKVASEAADRITGIFQKPIEVRPFSHVREDLYPLLLGGPAHGAKGRVDLSGAVGARGVSAGDVCHADRVDHAHETLSRGLVGVPEAGRDGTQEG